MSLRSATTKSTIGLVLSVAAGLGFAAGAAIPTAPLENEPNVKISRLTDQEEEIINARLARTLDALDETLLIMDRMTEAENMSPRQLDQLHVIVGQLLNQASADEYQLFREGGEIEQAER